LTSAWVAGICLPMRVSYCPGYHVPLPENHPFPMGKFPGLYDILLAEGLIHPGDVVAPEEAAWDDLLMVHTPAYLSALREGTLTAAEQRRMGLPWSAGLVHRSRLAVQGTVNAARMALQDGISANLAGGTHHAFPDHGEGFCVLNDVAVAIRVLQRSQQMRRALVVDLDVHQGNGTAAAFADDPAVYTFSMHGEKNYPWHKEQSSRDVGLADYASDAEYLSTLDRHLPEVFAEARPDLVFYLAGVDVLAGDRFGRLSLTPRGLQARDRYVLETAHARSVPLVILMSGGYAKSPGLTAEYHAIVHREAHRVFT
jgi:acetoin utilization deacetylase AcuC-like enzyme